MVSIEATLVTVSTNIRLLITLTPLLPSCITLLKRVATRRACSTVLLVEGLLRADDPLSVSSSKKSFRNGFGSLFKCRAQQEHQLGQEEDVSLGPQ